MKRQQEDAAKVLAAKANSSDVESYRLEAAAKMTEIKEDANTKLGTVSGEVTGIKQDLISTKEDFGRQLVDVKNVLNEGIARNSSELADLRKKRSEERRVGKECRYRWSREH